MPVWPLEVALLAGLLWVSWRIARGGFPRLLIGLAARLFAVLAVVLTLSLLGPVINAITRNFVLRLLDTLAAGMLVYWLVTWALLRLARRRNHALARVIEQRLPRWIDRTLCALAIATFWLAAFVWFDLTCRFIEVSNFGQRARYGSILVRYFIDPPVSGPAPAANGSDVPPDDPLDQQRRLLSGSRNLIGKSLDYLADATGARPVLAQLDALKTITNLPYSDRAWIVQNNPDLLALLKNPDVARLLRNDRVFDLIDRLSTGDVRALYLLGEEPDVQRLDGPEVRALLKKLDPAEMVRQVREHQHTRRQPAALAWRMAQLNDPAALDATAADPAAWKNTADPQRQAQRWPAGTRLGVLATTLAGAPGKARLVTLETPGRPRVWLAGRPVELSQLQENYLATLPPTAEPATLQIVIDFRDAPAAPACRVWVADPD